MTTPNYADLATQPRQYDDQAVRWSGDGDATSPRRVLMRRALEPHIAAMAGQTVLDVGSGRGWLCDMIAKLGGTPIGIEPSRVNVDAARVQYPGLAFYETALEGFKVPSDVHFDAATVIMTSEHFGDAERAYLQLSRLVKVGGKLIVLTGDYGVFTSQRFGYDVDVQELGPGEAAVRTDYPQAGVIHDIIRTPRRTLEAAAAAGFALVGHEQLTPTTELIAQESKYAAYEGQALFHLMVFENGAA